jgi:hypothetical protein
MERRIEGAFDRAETPPNLLIVLKEEWTLLTQLLKVMVPSSQYAQDRRIWGQNQEITQ